MKQSGVVKVKINISLLYTPKPLHPRQVAWAELCKQPVVGAPHKRKQAAGCYGVCCGEGTSHVNLCTVCRKSTLQSSCCGYKTLKVNPRIRIPKSYAKGRWKIFLRKFPQFKFREELRIS